MPLMLGKKDYPFHTADPMEHPPGRTHTGDTPCGSGKIPVGPNYVVSVDDDPIEMKNHNGLIYTYPQGK